ncbi:MAG: XRE family transcriptional regulator [Candidatus Methanofastidiosia archaeon]|jgi:Zn-dependent peptidase ImmA (M78 family)
MALSVKVEVSPEVFCWLQESSGWTAEEVAKRLKTSVEAIRAIGRGERQPTLRQLKELSKAYRRPLASFFLSEPLLELPLPKDYRMLPERKDVFDKKTLYAIRKARYLQKIIKELSVNIQYSTTPQVERVSLDDDPENLAYKYRELFNLSEERQIEFKTPYKLFHHMRDNLEDMNIIVFQFSMPVKDARGFALTDRTPNIIVVNTQDTIEARLFTLMHEVGHILLGETVIDIPDAIIKFNNEVEQWCNTFSSRFLLPRGVAVNLFKKYRSKLTETQTLGSLKYKYKVSKAMLLYNMFKLGVVTQEKYEETLDRYKPKEPEIEENKKKQRGGISQDKRCLFELGNKFVSIVAHNYDNRHITYADALTYLSVKSRNFEKVLAKARK